MHIPGHCSGSLQGRECLENWRRLTVTCSPYPHPSWTLDQAETAPGERSGALLSTTQKSVQWTAGANANLQSACAATQSGPSVTSVSPAPQLGSSPVLSRIWGSFTRFGLWTSSLRCILIPFWAQAPTYTSSAHIINDDCYSFVCGLFDKSGCELSWLIRSHFYLMFDRGTAPDV